MADEYDYEFRNCPRIIRSSKYERQSSEAFSWWMRLYQIMETEFLIPPYRRKTVVKQIFPRRLLQRIISIIKWTEEGLIDKALGRNGIPCPQAAERRSYENGKTFLSRTMASAGSAPDKKSFDRAKSKATNPYMEFFKRNSERVAIWRDLPPLSIEEMDLNQKAEAVTEAIAIDFVNWINKLSGETKTTLDVPQVVKMFEIGFNTNAATSLEVRVKEMPAVTKAVADCKSLPQRSVRAKLHEKIEADMREALKPEATVAFGKTLPGELRFVRPKENSAEKWVRSKCREDLNSMAVVWKGITDLGSTREFCKWLLVHPQLPIPKYLEKLGLLNEIARESQAYSISSHVIA